eukprot:21359_1
MVIITQNWKKKIDSDSFIMYVQLLNIPDEWEMIYGQLRMKCIEANASFTRMIALRHESTFYTAWDDRNLLLSELKALCLNEMNIEISFKVFQIESKKDMTIYRCYNNKMPFKKKGFIKWDIHKDVLKQFDHAYYGKSFESPINNNEPFIIRCYPKGRTKDFKGYLSIYVSMIHLALSVA